MVWGCMSSHCVARLHIVSGTVKAMDYIEILQNKLLPTARDLWGISHGFFRTITPLAIVQRNREQLDEMEITLESRFCTVEEAEAGVLKFDQPLKRSWLQSSRKRD
ncbi:hypothetical protein TNCV_160521 [Trichonephila clavipes]|nr:hypothetical protein TNCV_160521 [Trichonephila clavipes]